MKLTEEEKEQGYIIGACILQHPDEEDLKSYDSDLIDLKDIRIYSPGDLGKITPLYDPEYWRPVGKEESMSVYDKEFLVTPVFRKATNIDNHTKKEVLFLVDGEVYTYTYYSDPQMGVSEVYKRSEDGAVSQVYSSFKRIDQGAYYQEIGRRLSIRGGEVL